MDHDKPRVALVHDWLTGMRGGEKVLLSLARLFPDAPIYTLLHVPDSVSAQLANREIHTSFIQRLPGAFRKYRYYLPLFPAAIATFDLRAYDLVISSSHCVAKGARTSPSATHICYCHTPMRYVWDRYDDYFGPEHMSAPTRWLMPPVAAALRAWDVRTAPRVDRFIANSRYVAGRIERYYGRGAKVIPPPVDDAYFTPGAAAPGDYDLVVSALVPYKRIELILEAYRGTRRRLLIAGGGSEEARLRALAPPEVSFVGRVGDAQLRQLYRGCRAVVAAAIEDFGIVPLEAMACGRPAVVYAEGGGPETVTPGETGLIFHESTPQSLREVIDSLRHVRFNVDVLRQRAQAHGTTVFESRLREFVKDALDEPAVESVSGERK